MQIPALDDATLASVRAVQAHRFPQCATLRPPADRGIGSIEIPIIIGNPSGSCHMPPGSFVSDAWEKYVRPALTAQPEPDGLGDLLARDVILWPDAGVVDEILCTWAALTQSVAVKLLQPKIGRGAVSDPKPSEKPPAAVAARLAEHPRATWRWVRPAKGPSFALIVTPPGAAEYTIFNDEMKHGGNAWRLVRDFVASCVPAVFNGDEKVTLDSLINRWPGVAISLAKDAALLGGIDAEAELGE